MLIEKGEINGEKRDETNGMPAVRNELFKVYRWRNYVE